MFKRNTETTNDIIIKTLTSGSTIAPDALEIQDNLGISDTRHVSVFLLVDASASIRSYVYDINHAIQQFADNVTAPNSLSREAIDFCYITFNKNITVRRSLGYLSANEKNMSWMNLPKEDCKGYTDIAAALFTANLLAEKRKAYYKKKGIKYYQPVFVLLSDLGHNVTLNLNTPKKTETLLDMMLAQLTDKIRRQKLGMIEIVLGTPQNHQHLETRMNAERLYAMTNEHLNVKDVSQIGTVLSGALKFLHQTMVNPNIENIIRSDEDDNASITSGSVFIPAADDDEPAPGVSEKPKKRTRSMLF